MNIGRVFLPFGLILAMLVGSYAATSDVKVVKLDAYNTLRFSPNKIQVQPGQTVKLTLKNESDLPRTAMQHDWLLLRAGSDAKIYAKVALTDKADNYMPKSLAGEVIVGVSLLGPQESHTITFKAPETPGAYPFLCSSPGHSGDGMSGVLIVK